jgi:hypothetical protein
MHPASFEKRTEIDARLCLARRMQLTCRFWNTAILENSASLYVVASLAILSTRHELRGSYEGYEFSMKVRFLTPTKKSTTHSSKVLHTLQLHRHGQRILL